MNCRPSFIEDYWYYTCSICNVFNKTINIQIICESNLVFDDCKQAYCNCDKEIIEDLFSEIPSTGCDHEDCPSP